MRRLLARILLSLRSARAEQDLAREISAHLQLLEDQFVDKGMSRDEARYAAKRAFGGVEQAKELQRDARAFRWLAGWPMDLKLGVRMLSKTPGLTVIGAIALAIAIGAGAAYLEFTRDLLEPKLTFAGADRLVAVTAWNVERRVDETRLITDLGVWRASATQLEELGGARPVARHLTTPDGLTEAVNAVEINASGFRLVPAAPLLGRVLNDRDERPDAQPVAVIGERVWRNRFAGAPDVLGRLARLGAIDHVVVGVMPEGYGFPINHDLWIPLKDTNALSQIFGRLRAGATAAAAEAELRTMTADVRVQPYLDSLLDRELRSGEVLAVRALNLIFIMLLGICGANVATLVFARTAMREGEITVRTALGASRGRIIGQLFAEALVLSLLAAVVGLAAARAIGIWVKDTWQQGMGRTPFWWDDGLGLPTVAYAFALAVFAAVIVGIVPALKATGARLNARLRDAASGTATMNFGGVWTFVIVTQAAMTVAFLSAVVALGYSTLRKGAGDDVAYSRRHLLIAQVQANAQTREAVAERLRREPGVASVGYATALPGTLWEQVRFEFRDAELQRHADAAKRTDVLWVSGAGVGIGFFETIGMPVVAGRALNDVDVRNHAPVAVVDETFVRTTLGGRSPIGAMLRERAEDDRAPGRWLEIVGVVKDLERMESKGVEDSVIYRAAAPGAPLHLIVRTQGDAAPMTQSVYAAARTADASIRLDGLRTAERLVYDAALPERVFLKSFSVISAIALLLATAGIYALISFTLARRTREIGIRVALGAAPSGILRGIFARAFRQIGMGVAAGMLPGLVIVDSIAGDAGSMGLVKAFAVMLGIAGFVVAVALLSCTVPLRRALRVDPIRALRAE